MRQFRANQNKSKNYLMVSASAVLSLIMENALANQPLTIVIAGNQETGQPEGMLYVDLTKDIAAKRHWQSTSKDEFITKVLFASKDFGMTICYQSRDDLIMPLWIKHIELITREEYYDDVGYRIPGQEWIPLIK